MISGGRTRQSAVVRAVVAVMVLIGLAAAAYLIPLRSMERLRDWSESFGPTFTGVFFLGYAVITVFPAPRSAFSVSAGLLFGPATGFIGSMAATMFAAIVAFVVVRRYGRERVRPYLRSPVARSIERRMERRGWLAVGSLRLIVPFFVHGHQLHRRAVVDPVRAVCDRDSGRCHACHRSRGHRR